MLAVIGDGRSITEVAASWGISCQTLHTWLSRWEQGGLEGLADRSHRPARCPHRFDPWVEVEVLEARRAHPGRGAAADRARAGSARDRGLAVGGLSGVASGGAGRAGRAAASGGWGVAVVRSSAIRRSPAASRCAAANVRSMASTVARPFAVTVGSIRPVRRLGVMRIEPDQGRRRGRGRRRRTRRESHRSGLVRSERGCRLSSSPCPCGARLVPARREASGVSRQD